MIRDKYKISIHKGDTTNNDHPVLCVASTIAAEVRRTEVFAVGAELCARIEDYEVAHSFALAWRGLLFLS